MFDRRAITRLKAVLVIDILIVAVAAGSYFYLTGQGILTQGPKPAEFTLSDFTIDPPEAEAGEPVVISFNVTNVGETDGNYTALLAINNSTRDNQTISLAASESSLVTFIDTENVEGNYTVQIGDLTGSFLIKPAPPITSSITLSKLLATPYESWVNDTVSITAIATNPSSSTDSLGVKLTINGNLVETKRIELDAGQTATVEFIYNATVEGTFSVKVSNLISGFIIVPTGMHSLLVVSSPRQAIDFSIDGKQFKTPHTELLTIGVPHKVAFPGADPTGRFGFLEWEDGSKNPSRTITLTERTTVRGYFTGGTSCPSLFIWNGTGYVYVSEISNHGWLGYIKSKNSSNADVPFTFYRNNPWDYIPLDKNQLALTENSYKVTLNQKWNEIFYLDQAYLIAVDHPSDVNVYSTMVEEYLDPNYVGQIYTIGKNPQTPISAFNEKGQNVLPQISHVDNVFTPGINGLNSPSWDKIQWNTLTLNLGDLSQESQTKLVIRAVVDWGSPDDYGVWLGRFYDPAVPDGAEVTPPPFMEVKASNGSWIRVPESRQIPIPPDLVPRTFVVDLTGLFPTNDYSLRISNFWNVTFDYIGIDTTPQRNVTIRKIDPVANLYQVFTTGSAASGNFTKYGNVTELVTAEDDKFVIGKQGDEVSLQFPTSNLPAPERGMERDFLFFVSCWFKDENGNWGFGFGFTTDPLPFHNMSGFPYPMETESYPFEANGDYLREYNTRVVNPSSQEASIPIWLPVVTVILLVSVNLVGLIHYRKRSRQSPPVPPLFSDKPTA
jgi:hypothetical protein